MRQGQAQYFWWIFSSEKKGDFQTWTDIIKLLQSQGEKKKKKDDDVFLTWNVAVFVQNVVFLHCQLQSQ